jgi:hypothetical protein
MGFIEQRRTDIRKCFFVNRTLHRRMPSSGKLHHVALVRTDVSDELRASIIRVTRIDILGTLVVN